jgi:hypothetical protein
VRYQGQLYWLNWTDATHWNITIDVPPGTNIVTLEFLDYDKQLIGTASVTMISALVAGVEKWGRYF